MKKLLFLLLLLPSLLKAQVPALQDTVISGASSPLTPTYRYQTTSFGVLTYRYNPVLGKYALEIDSKYLRAYYAPAVAGGYVPYTGATANFVTTHDITTANLTVNGPNLTLPQINATNGGMYYGAYDGVPGDSRLLQSSTLIFNQTNNTLNGAANYSANYTANSYVQKAFTDASYAPLVSGGYLKTDGSNAAATVDLGSANFKTTGTVDIGRGIGTSNPINLHGQVVADFAIDATGPIRTSSTAGFAASNGGITLFSAGTGNIIENIVPTTTTPLYIYGGINTGAGNAFAHVSAASLNTFLGVDPNGYATAGTPINRNTIFLTDKFNRSSLGGNWAPSLATATLTFPGSAYMEATGGNGTATNYVEYNTAFMAGRYTDTLTVIPKDNSASSAIGLGTVSVSGYANAGQYVKIDMSLPNIASLVISDGNVYANILTQTQGIAFSVGDTLRMITQRSFNAFTFTLYNKRTKNSVSTTYVYNLGTPGKNISAIGKHRIYFYGGTQDIIGLSVINNMAVGVNFIGIGDSVTEGLGSTNQDNTYISKIFNGNSSLYETSSGGAEVSADAVTRLPSIVAVHPKYVMYNNGINDVRNSIPTSTYQANTVIVITTLQAAGITPILLSINPQNTFDVTPYNAVLQSLATTYGVKYIDAFTPITGGTGTQMLSIYNADGVHPNQAGHGLIAKTITDSAPELFGTLNNNVKLNNLPITTQVDLPQLVIENGAVKVLKNNIEPVLSTPFNTLGYFNTHKNYLVTQSTGDYIATTQNSVWNGSAYVSTANYGFGYASINKNSGTFIIGLGQNTAANNTGNTGLFISPQAGINNVGDNSMVIGQNNGYHNNWSGVTLIGHNINTPTGVFNIDATTTKSFTDANVDATAHTITIIAHAYGTVGKKVNLKFGNVSGTNPTGLSSNAIYQFTIIDVNTLYYSAITTAGSGSFTLSKDIDITNSVAVGVNNYPTKSGQLQLTGPAITEVHSTALVKIDAPDAIAPIVDGYIYSNSNFRGVRLNMSRARGTATAPLAVSTNDYLGSWGLWGWDGTSYREAASILTGASEVWTSTNHGTRIDIQTTGIGSGKTLEQVTARFQGGSSDTWVDIGGAGTTPATLRLYGGKSATQWADQGINFQTATSQTFTDNSTAASGTVASSSINSIAIPTIAATNANVTLTTANTLTIAGAPIAGTNVTITNPIAFNVLTGNVRFGAYATGVAHFTNGVFSSTLVQSGDLSTSLAIPGSPTTTTQAANTNNTTVATTAFVKSQYSQLKLTASGNGALTTISIAHGLSGITSTSFVNANAKTAAAGGFTYVTLDATNVNFIYTTAPVTGTNNLLYNVTITP